MQIPFEEKLPYSLLALVVLAVFYGIYFGKTPLARPTRHIKSRYFVILAGNQFKNAVGSPKNLLAVSVL